MDLSKRLKGKIINALRKVSLTDGIRDKAKKRAKIAPAAYKCENSGCEVIIYEGKRPLKNTGLQEEYDDVKKGKIHVDHIEPVIPVEGFPNKDWDWNIYINRLFCDKDGRQVLCEDCHKEKTDKENEIRKETRRKNKGKKK